MANLTRDEVLKKAAAGESFDRADLRGLDLSNAALEGVDLRRADLEGANLEGARLRGANLRNASLREAFLSGADLREVNLDKAELEGATLERAKLDGANLSRANLDGANLSGASLAGARLTNAQLQSANLGGADLTEANLSHADLVECYLGGSKLVRANLRNADLTSANLEEADLTDANADDAEVTGAHLERARAKGASWIKANLSKANLAGADFSGADLRHASAAGAKLGATLTGARVGGLVCADASLDGLVAEWVDDSRDGDGSRRVSGAAALAIFSGKAPAPSVPPPPRGQAVRYFGQGDVLRNATLEFGEGIRVQIDSRFEQCSIALGRGAELTIGKTGVLAHCRIEGSGNITLHGRFFERESPGIIGPSQLVVTAEGAARGPGGAGPGADQVRLRAGQPAADEDPAGAFGAVWRPGRERQGARMSGTTDKQSDKRTLVEEGTELKGSLTSTCPVLVRGKIEGNVTAPALTVSPPARSAARPRWASCTPRASSRASSTPTWSSSRARSTTAPSSGPRPSASSSRPRRASSRWCSASASSRWATCPPTTRARAEARALSTMGPQSAIPAPNPGPCACPVLRRAEPW